MITPRDAFQRRPLKPADARRMLLICGVLARPALRPTHVRRLLQLVDDPRFRTLPRLPSLNLAEPLFRHHLISQELDADEVFDFTSDSSLGPIDDFGTLAVKHYSRQALLREALGVLHRAGVGRVMLLKGIALAPFFEAPALRQMSDADVVVSAEDLPVAARALVESGWRASIHESSLVLLHESGFHLDLHAPLRKAGRQCWRDAVPHPHFEANILMPRPDQHLFFIAYHLAMHGGARIWRDVCDAHVLLDIDRGAAAGALGFAFRQGPEEAALVAALMRFMGRWSPHSRRYETLQMAVGGRIERRVDELARLYERLAVDPAPVAALEMLRPLAVPERFVLPRGPAHPMPHFGAKSVSVGWSERDPALGTLPAVHTRERILFKIRLLFSLLGSGKLLHYLLLMRHQHRLAAAPPLFGGNLKKED